MSEQVFENPLRQHVNRRKQWGEKGVQRHIRNAFLQRGWHASDALISQWCRDQRRPDLQNQLRIEAVTHGEVKPTDWLKYWRQRIEQGNGKPKKTTARKRSRRSSKRAQR